ncbi:hypothetical protein V6N11_023464 [Hibiscus sabdariffa]|uniref:RNase H type-1 domain-containing protein n=1 Tax=Hibiscus sabdariffa TaxID=183260 RepID=A0ABR2TMC2_9ROSI
MNSKTQLFSSLEQRVVITNAPRQWTLPSPGVIKVNCDVSFDASLNIAGIAAVLRDSAGSIIGGANRTTAWKPLTSFKLPRQEKGLPI